VEESPEKKVSLESRRRKGVGRQRGGVGIGGGGGEMGGRGGGGVGGRVSGGKYPPQLSNGNKG